jgi:small subunit ribosomal protein S3
MAESLERGWHFRRVGHSTVQRVMASGAQGVIVEIAGKLSGAKRRREKFIAGHVKYAGETAYSLMDHGYAQCKRKLGIIGCSVKIMKKDAKLPDEVKIFAPGEKDAAMAAQKARSQAQAQGVQTAPDAPKPAEGAAPAQAPTAPVAPAAPSGPSVPKPADGPARVPGADERRRERKSFTVGNAGGSQ